MLAATTPVVRDTRRTWVRALTVAGGAAAAAIAWTIEVPLLGVRLSVRFGPMHSQTIVAGQVIGAALVAGLLGWLLLTVLERRTSRARATWTGAALAVLVLSLGLPAATATTTAAAVALVMLHLVVAAAVIPALAATSRPPR